MFGLSIKNLRNSFSFNHIGGFSRELATVKKVYRWHFKRLFSPYPTFKEQVEANEYGITSDIRWHEVFADGFAESEITRVLQRRIKKDRDYKREVRWMKALELHIGHLMKTRKKPDVYLFEDRAIFVERGRYAASFFKTRNRLGFFAKRFSSCSDPKNIIGFIRAPLYYMHAYTGFSSTREKIVIGLVRGMTGGNMCWQVSGEGKEVIKILKIPVCSKKI